MPDHHIDTRGYVISKLSAPSDLSTVPDYDVFTLRRIPFQNDIITNLGIRSNHDARPSDCIITDIHTMIDNDITVYNRFETLVVLLPI